MCQTSEGTREPGSLFKVSGGIDIPGRDQKIYEILYPSQRATVTQALGYFIEHVLGGDEISNALIDPLKRRTNKMFDDEGETYTALVIFTKRKRKKRST